jgi:hypothetical protein
MPPGRRRVRIATCDRNLSEESMARALCAQTRSSRRGFVFVEEATEEVAPPDLRRRKGRFGHASDSAVAIRRA